MENDYADLVAELLSTDEEWSRPHVASLRARVLHLALYFEGLRAVHGARSRGTNLCFYEWSSRGGDRFEIKINGRSVGFERDQGKVKIVRDGFPYSLVPPEAMYESIEPPRGAAEAADLARAQIRLALRQLLQNLP